MNITLSSGPEAFVCSMHPEGTPQAYAHSVGKLRHNVAQSPEKTDDFYTRVKRVERESGVLLYVTRALSDQHFIKSAVAYVLATAEPSHQPYPDVPAPDSVDTEGERSTGRNPKKLVVDELYVTRKHRRKGLGRLMLNRLAFGRTYSDLPSPTGLSIGDWLHEGHELEPSFSTAGFARDEVTGRMKIRLPGDHIQVRNEEDHKASVKQMPYDWCGVLDIDSGLRRPGYMELYRGGDMLARLTETDWPAGLVVEGSDISNGAPQLHVPVDQSSPTLDELYRSTMLRLLNDQEFLDRVS